MLFTPQYLALASLTLFLAGAPGSAEIGVEELCTSHGLFSMQAATHSMDYSTLQLGSFCAFMELHQRKYGSIDEVNYRMEVYLENERVATGMTALDESALYSAQQSPFGDFTSQEFKEAFLFNGAKQIPEPLGVSLDRYRAKYRADSREYRSMEKYTEPFQQRFRTISDAEPMLSEQTTHKKRPSRTGNEDSGWDWVEQGKVTPVKNQGSLGTCWAFSAMAVIESQVAIHQNVLADLSVEQLVECANDFNSSSGEADCAEFGGWPYLGFEYVAHFGGAYRESDFPYCSGTVDAKTLLPHCFPCMPKAYDRASCGDHSDLYCDTYTTKGQVTDGLCSTPQDLTLTKLSSWEKLSQDEEVLKEVLREKGPISVAMSALILQFYLGGVISLPLCSSSAGSLDHALVLVGYGEKETIFGNSLPYWKVKNSWGAKWGEKGYFRLKRGSGMCGINLRPSIAYV